MKLNETLELPLFKAASEDPKVEEFRAYVHRHGWVTRDEIIRDKGWSAREVRAYASALGAGIVKCTRGFKLTEDITEDELGIASRAADAALSQARVQQAYGLDLKRRLHARIG